MLSEARLQEIQARYDADAAAADYHAQTQEGEVMMAVANLWLRDRGDLLAEVHRLRAEVTRLQEALEQVVLAGRWERTGVRGKAEPPRAAFFEYPCPRCEGTGLATTEPFPTVAGKCIDCKGSGHIVGYEARAAGPVDQETSHVPCVHCGKVQQEHDFFQDCRGMVYTPSSGVPPDSIFQIRQKGLWRLVQTSPNEQHWQLVIADLPAHLGAHVAFLVEVLKEQE